MPSGGARAGSGKKAAFPDNCRDVVVVKNPKFYSETQVIGVKLDAAMIHKKMVKWLTVMGVLDKVDPFLIEEYVICTARVRQLEQVVSMSGADSVSTNSGDLYETPSSKRIDKYMKRADAARVQIYQVIRDAGMADALDGAGGVMVGLIGGAPSWRTREC